MNKPIIRKAISGEESEIHEAHMRSIREVCVKDHGEEEIKGWGYRELGDRWKGPIVDGNVWVVEQNKVIYGVGYIRFFEEDSVTQANLHALYLTSEVMHKGIGYKLMKIMLDKAKEVGARSIKLVSSITAHEFYKRIGFVDTGPMEFVEIGGVPVRTFPMELNVD